MNRIELQKRLEAGESLNQISKITSKSLTTVRYWVRKYDLESNYSSFKGSNRKGLKYKRGHGNLSNFKNKNKSKIDISKEELEFLVSEGKTTKEICIILNCSRSCIQRASKTYGIKIPLPLRKLTQEQKDNLSTKRKEFLKNNPDKHPWKNNDKFKSLPCIKVKEFLKSKNIDFIEEYPPEIEGRFFSIDIAFPDKMVALEINGNQHYEKDGSLKPYYQERHDLLIENGWNVFEIHYSACFNLDKWGDFANQIENYPKLNNFKYNVN
jgi:hypothetical protein